MAMNSRIKKFEDFVFHKNFDIMMWFSEYNFEILFDLIVDLNQNNSDLVLEVDDKIFKIAYFKNSKLNYSNINEFINIRTENDYFDFLIYDEQMSFSIYNGNPDGWCVIALDQELFTNITTFYSFILKYKLKSLFDLRDWLILINKGNKTWEWNDFILKFEKNYNLI
jgi:hypothetical protein